MNPELRFQKFFIQQISRKISVENFQKKGQAIGFDYAPLAFLSG